MACARNLVVAKMRAACVLRAFVFTCSTWINNVCAIFSSKSITAVTLEGVDTVVTDSVEILPRTRIHTIYVYAIVFVHLTSRTNESFDASARYATDEVCAFALMKAPATRSQL